MSRSNTPVGAIAGLGITEMGRIYDKSTTEFGLEAVRLACADSGIAVSEIDGLLVNPGVSNDLTIRLSDALGRHDLRLLSSMQQFGTSACAMVQYAALAIKSGAANAVACVFADTPLVREERSGERYSRSIGAGTGFRALPFVAGLRGAPSVYALAARRHMNHFGTTSEQLASVAVQTREWASRNPRAIKTDPMTIADHHASRMIADPLRVLDCCLVNNGAIAIIVTSEEVARDSRQPPVYIHGWGQSHPGWVGDKTSEFGLVSGAKASGRAALDMAGIGIGDITAAEIYDCFTITTLLTLEDYGFCEKGQGGAFVADGNIGPGGTIPVNTGGGQLSGYYMWGMTPISEAVIQARGQGGERQVGDNSAIIVSGNGGWMEYHSTLVVSPHATL
ncbi:thiolase family protein [Amycolatopsis sp. GM8]|uniref:thiolase family protein n=1 Tax=Amycolatopsis sp. GM8 TaxID=2896530 RepID=UPI001F1CD4F4|nr:thiolase family protein [Amycolatopsis sp. GM8]